MYNIKWDKSNSATNRTNRKRTYDVRVTLNKSGMTDEGKQRYAIRFGFLNEGVKVAPAGKYIEASSPLEGATRLYFRVTDDKASTNCYKVTKGKGNGGGTYFAKTLTDINSEKAYRMNWINGEFKIQYDSENEMYYIERRM